MRRYLLAPALLVLAACQPAENAPPPADTTPAATAPESKSPTVSEVQAAITSRAAADFQRKPLNKALPDGIDIPVAYHRLFENRADAGAGSEYRALVETFDPAETIEAALDSEFVGRGFAIKDKSSTEASVRILVYERLYGPVVTIRLSPRSVGTAKAPGATGTLHLTWVSPK